MGERWAYHEAYGDGCTTEMGLVYPLIEDDVSTAHLVDIHNKSMAMVRGINKELLIRSPLIVNIRETEINLCGHNQVTHSRT